jgi:alginate O-acetyltransferase complex protein AlgI
MTFTSLAFVGFVGLVLASYNLVAQERRAVVLITAGYMFCAFAHWQAAVLLISVTLATYLLTNALAKWGRKWLVIIGLLLILSPLIISKFWAQLGDLFFSREMVPSAIALGLSFYTLQAVGYVLDVYWKRVQAERSVLTVALYLAFFPIVQSGPIERAGNLIPQLFGLRRTNARAAFLAGKQILWGFFCKLVIADKIAIIVSDIFARTDERSGPIILVGLGLFALQLYFDFYGYTSIAIGIARLFGIQIIPNFNHPYLATSLRDFWHRWHISLSTWLRDYVYLPLGGRQNSKIRYMAVVMLVFVLSGMWHGSSVNFIVWGIIHATLYLIGQRTSTIRMKIWELALADKLIWLRRALQQVIIFGVVSLVWVFFLVPTWQEAITILHKIFSLGFAQNTLALNQILGRPDYQIYIFLTIICFVVDSLGFIGSALDSFPERRYDIAKELVVVNCLVILLVLIGDIGAKGFIYMYF